ncbi:MAG: porin family protein [Gammaproteobacteria bacterium]
MLNKKLILALVIALISIASISKASTGTALESKNSSKLTATDLVPVALNGRCHTKYRHPFYVGVTGGYGQTTWGQLVPADTSEQALATLSVSTPIRVGEGGAVWGVYAGYELIPQFAFELSYMRYPNATLVFDSVSLFAIHHDGETSVVTRTESVALVAKLMVPIPRTDGLRAYSSFGAAGVHRFDIVVDRWRASPTFGVGFNYLVTQYMMLELGTEYVAGYGQSEIEPDEHYIPFLYSGFLRMALRFG